MNKLAKIKREKAMEEKKEDTVVSVPNIEGRMQSYVKSKFKKKGDLDDEFAHLSAKDIINENFNNIIRVVLDLLN